MRISDLPEAEFLRYFQIKLEDKKLRQRAGEEYMALCPFHDDSKPSLSVNIKKGTWNCFSGCGSGGLIDFERKLDPGCDVSLAIARISEIIGLPQLKLGGTQPEAIYQYRDANNCDYFQVVRMPGKKFAQRRPNPKGGWDYSTKDLTMVLYRLPEVIQALEVFIVEGEKDADNLQADLDLLPGLKTRVVATTSPRGAGRWQDRFAPYLTGKKVVILPDQDEPGQKHAQQVATSAYRYANGVKIVNLPGVKDYSEWRFKGHTLAEIFPLVRTTPLWAPAPTRGLLSLYKPFEEAVPTAVDWLVEGLIEKGSNGMLIARPKAGKSFLILHIAMCMAYGCSFLGFHIPRRIKTAYFSREDNPATTGHRARKLRLGLSLLAEELDGWLYINTRQQSAEFMLDSAEQVNEVIAVLKKLEIEVAIFDVMRVIHSADENDNTEMQKAIVSLNKIRDEAGVTVVVIHHSKKGDAGASITEMARGAGAIAGWTEWIAGIRVVDSENWVRSFEVEMKGAEPPKAFYWKINDIIPSGPGPVMVHLEKMPDSYEPPKSHKSSKSEPWDTKPDTKGFTEEGEE